MPSQWIKHKGMDILYSDFSNMRNPAEPVQLLESIDKLYPAKGPKVRHMMNVENAALGPEFMEASKTMGKKYISIGYKDAFIGISPLKSVLLKGFLMFTGGADKAKIFSSIEDAKNWLAE